MADEFGIRLSVSAADLLSSINTALDKINADPALNKLKLGIDTSDIDKAVKRLKTEISSITNNISVPKIDLGISGSPEKSTLGSVDKSQTGQINEIVKAYMNAFSIIKQSGTETAKDIQLKFNNALTDFFEAKSSGNADNIKRTFDELTMLTKNYTKQFKNTDAINYLNTLKDGLEGIVPVSRDVFEDLKYIYDGGRNAANALNKAFGVKGWKIDNWTDVYLESLPDWMLSKDSYTAPVQGLQKLIELFQRAREQAKIKLDIFSDGSGIEKMTTFLAHCEELLDIRQRQAESAEKTAQSEKQVTAALQSEAEVAEKLRNAMTPVIGDGTDNYVSRVLTDIGSYKGVVDALGQALDRLSSAKGLNMSAQMSDLNDCLTMFREGMNSPEELIRNLNSFAAAERNVTAEINAEKTAVNNVTAEIDKLISKKKQANIVSDKSKGGKTAGDVGIGIDAGALIKSINAAVRGINKNDADSLANIKLSANEAGLRSSIRQAVSDINKSKILDSSPVKLSVTFKNIKSAVSALNKQLSGMTVKVNVNGSVDNNGVPATSGQVANELQRQALAHNNLKQAVNDTAQAVIDASNKEKTAINSVDEAIAAAAERYRKLGYEIKTVQTNTAGGMPISKSIKTGTNEFNVTDRYNYNTDLEDFVPITQTIEENTAAARSNVEKMVIAAEQLNIKLKDRVSSIKDKNAARPIEDTKHLDALNAKIKEIEQSIISMTNTDASQHKIISKNIEGQITELKILEREYRNAEYAANQLRNKGIEGSKNVQANELDRFTAKITQSKVPISQMQTDIDNLKRSLESVGDKKSLTKFLNELDVAKSKFGVLNEQTRTINTAVKALDRIGNLSIFGNNRGNSEVISLMGSVDKLRNKYLTLKNDFVNADTPETLASVNEQLSALQAKLRVL